MSAGDGRDGYVMTKDVLDITVIEYRYCDRFFSRYRTRCVNILPDFLFDTINRLVFASFLETVLRLKDWTGIC